MASNLNTTNVGIFDFGERISQRRLDAADLNEARRLLARFKGYVDESDAPLANAHDLGEMARKAG